MRRDRSVTIEEFIRRKEPSGVWRKGSSQAEAFGLQETAQE